MQLGLGWIFVGAYAVENGRSIDIALLRATSLYYRGNPPIRNSQFPIWAKGKGVLGPSKTAIFKKYT